MFGFIIFVHVIVCLLLSLMILMQSGRGGGLAESFASAESMFGARTNVVLVKATTVLGTLFVVTCLSLAFYSAKSNKSLIGENVVKKEHTAASGGIPIPSQNATVVGKQDSSDAKTENQPITNSTTSADHK